MPHIVIAGAGFAATTAVKTLRKQGFKGSISLVAPRAELFYYPSLIWIPAGIRSLSDLVIPLHDFLAKHDVHYVPSTVTGLDVEKRRLKLEKGEIEFDALLIATGGRYIQKLPGIQHAHVACSG